ncbi:peptide-N4-asparagine amidase [Tunturiibacter lichenicola]|uniref:peptide-N4-asparagine amidase n=1 Tax=Tunturiibacter lichenicola TaxID=2051959 RepID=UPI0021B2696E|nr:peptide-N4-asparagine amidase [Edaphobacter lichenicola]
MNRAFASSHVVGILPSISKLLLILSLSTVVVPAQVIVAPTTPQVGSSNPVTAEPLVSRPHTKPCVVQLLTNSAFESFTPAPLNYTPPAACPGPWAKVVLTADFTVSAGIQYDRSAWFYLNNVNIFYGTTAEPGSKLSPSWHVERDLTDLSALFKSPQTGAASIGNIVNSSYTGIIYANAALEFYPASWQAQAPVVPDIVDSLSSGNSPATLNTGADQVTQTVTLPRNVEKVYLDVISQSQIGDEFWYFCVPNDVAGELESCGNSAFRETEISIDGKPAGVAPVYPWIFTGGLDPYLWIPITGVQTLNFKPYRVDLTPFAGVLGDGSEHTVAISVFNANGYFLSTANLLVYTDHGSKEVTGGLLSNTLSAEPTPQVSENLATDSTGTTTGTVAVGSDRSFTISGYVNTSHGRVETTVEQKINFLSTQTFDVNPNVGPDNQSTVQTSTVDSETTTRTGFLVEKVAKHISFPLTLNYALTYNANGTYTQVVSSNQQDVHTEAKTLNNFPIYESNSQEQVSSKDTLQYDANFNLTAAGVGKSSASYLSHDSLGECYSRSLTAANQILTSVTDGKGCHQGWF